MALLPEADDLVPRNGRTPCGRRPVTSPVVWRHCERTRGVCKSRRTPNAAMRQSACARAAAALGSESMRGVSPLAPSQVLAVITDPLFYLLAIPAIVALGLGKGGFAGVGMISTPLLALTMPPLQAAAILLPIVLCQDVISAWT